MSRIAVFGIGMASKSPTVTAQLIQNIFCETRPADGEKSQLVGYGSAGLDFFLSFGASPARGGQELESTSLAYVAQGGTFWEVNNAGVTTARGALLTTTGRVSFADNGFQVMCVDGTYGYLFQPNALGIAAQTISSLTRVSTLATMTTAAPHGLSTGMIIIVTGALAAAYNGTFEVTVTGASTLTYVMASDPGGSASPVGTYSVSAFNQITDPGFPANPVTVSFLSGRFIVTCANSGRFNVSALFDGWTWPALNFSNAQTQPDPIVSGWVSNGQFIPLGSRSTEFWTDSGQVSFPFNQIVGTANEWGLAALWSVAKFDNTFACLMKNRTGQVGLYQMAGYVPKKISTPDFDTIINRYANTADASAYSYMEGGHQMYQINFPIAGKSWLYDGLTGFLTQVKSWQISRQRSEFSFSFLGSTITADYSSGILYRLKPDTLTENGSPIERMLISETIAAPDLDRLEVNKFRVDMEVGDGVAVGQGSNPQICLSVSRDNGRTYGSEMWRTLGPVGDYGLTVDWDCLGTARNFVFKLLMTDPVPFCLVSATINPDD